MTQKYFDLLQVCKQISPEVKERLEELKFGCFVKLKHNRRLFRISFVSGNIFYFVEDFFNSGVNVFGVKKNKIEEILGQLTIAGFVELLGDEYLYRGNSIIHDDYEPYNAEHKLVKVCTFETGKELFEQSEETLQKCIDLVKKVYGIASNKNIDDK